MRNLSKAILGVTALALTISTGPLSAKPVDNNPTGNAVYAQVMIWDIPAAQAATVQNTLYQKTREMIRVPGFVNERVLRNIDTLTFHFATYTKGTNRAALEAATASRNQILRGYASRDPEVHTLVLKHTYWGADGGSSKPTGTEYDRDAVGQVAHLGVFVPFNDFRPEYDRTLDHVKVFTRDRLPAGYLGEDVLDGADMSSPNALAPYTPRPFEAARVSVNYGEYETLEDAENSYIKRGEDRPNDPRILAWERMFYSALQVPTRFYIFRVVDSVRGPGRNQVQRLTLSR